MAPVRSYLDHAFGGGSKKGPQPPITVEEREGRGRCVVATMPLPKGTSLPIISDSSPFATCVMPSLRKERCAVCLQAGKRGAALLACVECGHTYYCSDACRKAVRVQHVGKGLIF